MKTSSYNFTVSTWQKGVNPPKLSEPQKTEYIDEKIDFKPSNK